MIQQRKSTVFSPGMQCPGGCGRVLNSRDDLHYKYVSCSPCGDTRHAAEMRAARTKEGKRCKCGKRIGDRSNVCRACNAPSIRAATTEARPSEYRVFPGLRGPGGEMEAEREMGRPYSRRRGQSGATV